MVRNRLRGWMALGAALALAPAAHALSITGYAITANAGNTAASPQLFDARRTGSYYAAYAQDNIKWGNLTTNLGLRYDNNNLPQKDTAWEPRLGAAYYIPGSKTVFRASYNRVMYTPEFENILLSSSDAAA